MNMLAAMVLQLGENALLEAPGLNLRTRMQEDLEELVATIPGLKIFWSQLLQRHAWRGSCSPAVTERARKRIQSVVARKVLSMGGALICHPGITYRNASIYTPDGVHLVCIWE